MDQKERAFRGGRIVSNYTQDTKLRLKTKIGVNQKSIIEDMYFTPPLKIIDPLYEEHPLYGEVANIMLLSVSAGLMEGDTQEIDITIGKDTKVVLSSQSFEKIHNTQDGKAMRISHIKVESNAFLDFSPLPVIPFANSSFENITHIDMAQDSTLSYSEVFCAGRVSRGEIFEFKSFVSRLKIHRDGKLVFFDNTFLDPLMQDLKNMCHFGPFTHYLNWIIIDDKYSLEDLRERLTQFNEGKKINASLSQNSDAIIIKALGYGSEELLELKEALA